MITFTDCVPHCSIDEIQWGYSLNNQENGIGVISLPVSYNKVYVPLITFKVTNLTDEDKQTQWGIISQSISLSGFKSQTWQLLIDGHFYITIGA